MQFDMGGLELTKYISYAYLIFGLVGLLLVAIFANNLDFLSSIGLPAYDLIISSIFDIVIFIAIYLSLKNLEDKKGLAVLLVIFAFLDIILFQNIIAVLFAMVLVIAAYTLYKEAMN